MYVYHIALSLIYICTSYIYESKHVCISYICESNACMYILYLHDTHTCTHTHTCIGLNNYKK